MLCQNLWEHRHLCSPAACALILQSASASAVQTHTHTPAWNCYKAHCLLSQTGFDRAALPVCEWLFVRRLSLFETCSLIPAHALCVRALIPRASGRIGWVMGTRVNLLFPILSLLNWMLIGVSTDKRLKRRQSVTCTHVGPSLLTNAYMQGNECTHKLFRGMASKITLNDQLQPGNALA